MTVYKSTINIMIRDKNTSCTRYISMNNVIYNNTSHKIILKTINYYFIVILIIIYCYMLILTGFDIEEWYWEQRKRIYNIVA